MAGQGSKYYFAGNVMIAMVWFINGFWCKILNQVPRHQEIVASILHLHPRLWTILIGVSEVLFGVWILRTLFTRLTAWMQVVIILMMNVIEFYFARDLLLFGQWNIVFALLFCSFILFNEYVLKRQTNV